MTRHYVIHREEYNGVPYTDYRLSPKVFRTHSSFGHSHRRRVTWQRVVERIGFGVFLMVVGVVLGVAAGGAIWFVIRIWRFLSP